MQKKVLTPVVVGAAAAVLSISALVGYSMHRDNVFVREVPAVQKLDSLYHMKNYHTSFEKHAYKSQRNLLWEEYIHSKGKGHLF